jgi:hypothetical protein
MAATALSPLVAPCACSMGAIPARRRIASPLPLPRLAPRLLPCQSAACVFPMLHYTAFLRLSLPPLLLLSLTDTLIPPTAGPSSLSACTPPFFHLPSSPFPFCGTFPLTCRVLAAFFLTVKRSTSFPSAFRSPAFRDPGRTHLSSPGPPNRTPSRFPAGGAGLKHVVQEAEKTFSTAPEPAKILNSGRAGRASRVLTSFGSPMCYSLRRYASADQQSG